MKFDINININFNRNKERFLTEEQAKELGEREQAIAQEQKATQEAYKKALEANR